MTARVGVVVVNHNGGELTLDCLRSLDATEWPRGQLEIVLVDNASADQSAPDGTVARVRADHPGIRVLTSATNLGFAGGCNLAIRALTDVDHIALVNNDATVEPGWLAPLVATLESDERIGAACSKILFAGTFSDVHLTAAATHRRGRGDRRDLGVRIAGARVDGEDVWRRTQRVRGFWGADPGPEWTQRDAVLRLPVRGDAPVGELMLDTDRSVDVTVGSGATTTTVAVSPVPTWTTFTVGGPRQTIINNVGTELLADGYGVDRGYLEPDHGQFDEPVDVFAWCGAGALLRRTYLGDIGLFDERLFLYYEDLELAWRGARRGWRYRTAPTSVIRHIHAATTGEGSELKERLNDRNRLLVIRRHRGATAARRAAWRYGVSTASYAAQDVVSPLLHGQRPRFGIVRRRLQSLRQYAFGARGFARF